MMNFVIPLFLKKSDNWKLIPEVKFYKSNFNSAEVLGKIKIKKKTRNGKQFDDTHSVIISGSQPLQKSNSWVILIKWIWNVKLTGKHRAK